MTLAELRARLNEIVARQQAILDDAGEDDLSEELQTEFDQLTAEFKKVKNQIKRLEALEANQSALGEGTGRLTPAADPASPRITGGQPASEDDPMRGFSDEADFGRAVFEACRRGGEVDQRLRVLGAPTNFHSESGADGFMVPPAMRDGLWELVFDDDDLNLLNLVDPEPTESNSVTLIADESTPWGATGVQANWAQEGSQFSGSRLETEGRLVRLHKLFAFVEASEELIEDSSLLTSRLTRGASMAIRWKASNAIVFGSGAGQPLGWMNSGALVIIAKEAGQGADTIVPLNVAKMLSRLLGMSARAFWLANSDTLPQLVVMTIGDQPIWTPPASGITNAPGGFLFGRPILFSEHAKTVGDLGDLQLVDPAGYYAITKRGGIKFASSIHLFFDHDVQAFRWTFRLGGQPFLEAPVDPPNSSNTKSHFVALAERS